MGRAGLSSRAGTALLALVAQGLGLTDGLSAALAGTRERRSGHALGLPAGQADAEVTLRAALKRLLTNRGYLKPFACQPSEAW